MCGSAYQSENWRLTNEVQMDSGCLILLIDIDKTPTAIQAIHARHVTHSPKTITTTSPHSHVPSLHSSG